ncbi:unnamed protein product [Hyaloperonospora brassicae]|uniref:Nucleolar protein 14 n=1 Tax=Hyaloperonospora brassicae TaxID=162125 RepID=A0AAV0USI8_HYABA|nr:unnamed protein product [Hyaloperonospora brassicae]
MALSTATKQQQKNKKNNRKKSRPQPAHAVVRSRPQSSRGSNPFDARCNATKAKYEVLGRRVKGASRNVAAARAAAELKRRRTLGVEFRARKKSNVFKDKRLGEQDPTLSMEDKMMARFQTERKRQMRNAAAFALHDSDNDEDDDGADGRYGGLFLTHRGARITDDDAKDVEKDVDNGGDRSETEEDWKMDREIVNTLHFGGGGGAQAIDEGREGTGAVKKTHKEVMQEVMMKAKLYKAERQKNKSAQEEATDQLDEGFADLCGLLEFRPTRANGKEVVPKEPMDAFDTLTREFAFEAKVKATERRLSPEEAAAKERDRLAALEKKRVARMHGADGDDSDDGDAADGRRKGRKSKKKVKNDKTSDAGEEEEEGEGDEEESHDVDDDSDEQDSEAESDVGDGDRAEDEKDTADNVETVVDEQEEVDDCDSALQKRIDDAEEAAHELPFVFPCPESPEALAAIFKQHARHSPAKRALILDRIVTYYSPRLSVENQSKMKTFFAVLVRQFLLFAARYAAHKHDLDSLATTMYTLAQQMGDSAGVVVRQVLAQLHKRLHKRTSTCAWPSLAELLLLKALTRIFPTSDLRHNVTSPIETLLGESLARGAVPSPHEAVQALFAASLSLDMTRAKERFVPELVTFLTRLLRAIVVAPASDDPHERHPSHWLRRDVLEHPTASTATRLSLATASSTSASASGGRVLTSLLKLLELSSAQYAHLPSFDELFYPLYLLLHALAQQLDSVWPARGRDTSLSSTLHEVIEALHARLAHCWARRRPLCLQQFAPRVLPTFAPQFDANYTVRKDKLAPKDAAQRQQLQRQVKRARKGAARELRRDADFLAREKQREEHTRCAANAAKQKEIRRWLDEQHATFHQQVRKGGEMLKGGGSARGPAPRARASKAKR